MNYTLNLMEIQELLLVECYKHKSFDEDHMELKELFERSKYWDAKLSILNHLKSRALERLYKRNIEGKPAIDFIYDLSENQNVEVQEGTIHFLDNLLEGELNPLLELEDKLRMAQDKLYAKR